MSTKKSILKDKGKLNLCIDFVLFILLAAMAGVGLLIKFVLISGEKRNFRYGEDINLLYCGLDRHQWGTIHLVISLLFILFLVLHIIFHWNMILCLLKRLIPNKTGRIIFNSLITTLGILFFVFAFLITPTEVYHEHNYRNRTNTTLESAGYTDPTQISDSINQVPTQQNKQNNKTHEVKHKQEKLHEQKNRTIVEEYEVQGNYSLQYVADKYNVPCSHLCNKLNVPQNLSSERLGRIRKKHNFTMADVSKVVAEYKNQKPQ